jgi:hypothetical protein
MLITKTYRSLPSRYPDILIVPLQDLFVINMVLRLLRDEHALPVDALGEYATPRQPLHHKHDDLQGLSFLAAHFALSLHIPCPPPETHKQTPGPSGGPDCQRSASRGSGGAAVSRGGGGRAGT